MIGAPPVRDAATLILVRNDAPSSRVLMGQRGAGAAFMPSKFVFPGGAYDTADQAVTVASDLAPRCVARLAESSALGQALAVTALRELLEETGLTLGAPKTWEAAPLAWHAYTSGGHCPHLAPLRFIFRAITPPNRPRRFDARFFLAPAEALSCDPDAFNPDGELAHLQWIPLDQVRDHPLPFITEVVLAEVAQILQGNAQDDGVPFVIHDENGPSVRRLVG